MKGVRIKIIFGWRPYWSATLLTGLLTKSVESIVSRTVVTQGHSQRTYADQVGEDPVFPRTSSRLTEKLSPCLGGPLNKVEINIAEFMTINTKTVFKPYFCEIENPTSWKRRMFFRRLFRTFIMWKKIGAYITEPSHLHTQAFLTDQTTFMIELTLCSLYLEIPSECHHV